MRYFACAFLLLGFSADANAGISLDFTDLTAFSNLGTNSVAYTTNVLIGRVSNPALLDSYEIEVTMTTSGAGNIIVLNSAGFVSVQGGMVDSMTPPGLFDADFIHNDEDLNFSVTLTPDPVTLPPVYTLQTFEFESIEHGEVVGDIEVIDDSMTLTSLNMGGATSTALTGIGGLDFQFGLQAVTGSPLVGLGSRVRGVSGIEFRASSLFLSAVPEPSSAWLCAICFGGFVTRRRRRQ